MKPIQRCEMLLAEVGVIALIGCGIALPNLFNPSGWELGARMAFWIGGLLAAWVLFGLIGEVGKAVARLLVISSLWGYVIAIPLATALISWALLWWLGGTEAMLGRSFARIWPQTSLIGVSIFVLFFFLHARRNARMAGPDSATSPTVSRESASYTTRLHERLPKGFPAIIALSAEDHYVHAYAQDQSAMVLTSLAEAIDMMPPNVGQKVHRSWWVTREAVRQTKRDGRDMKLHLTNGLRVPVSRDRVPRLREQGWFD